SPFPNLLVNGAGGIAVGMATNIPPHNLGEVLAACRAYMDDPAIGSEGLLGEFKGPAFPPRALLLCTTGLPRRPLHACAPWQSQRLYDWTWFDPHALALRGRGRARRPPLDRPHRNPVP